MKVLTFLPRFDLRGRVANVLCPGQFVVETAVSAKECLQCAQLARYEAVLVDSDSLIFADALALVRLLRQENSRYIALCLCPLPGSGAALVFVRSRDR